MSWHGRGLDEWVPVALGFACRPRRGALCAGAASTPGDGDGAQLHWPDGRVTVVARLCHPGLRALEREPRAAGEAMAAWLRGLGELTEPQLTVTLLSISGPGGAPPRDATWADTGIAADALVAVTCTTPFDVAGALLAAGLGRVVALDEAALAAMLARQTAPAMGSILSGDVVGRWHHLEAPCSMHASYVVAEWPMGDVDEQVLTALSVSRDRRTVALHLRTEELARARERTARVRTSAAADEAIVARGGFLASPESSRDAVRDAERADELAAGHGSLRLLGVVVLDADDALGLEAAAARLLADATACGVRLRRCDGDHRRGVLAAVPGWCVP